MRDAEHTILRQWVIGFTGHRRVPNPAGAAEVIGAQIAALRQKLGGEPAALSSVASGADSLFAGQVLAAGSPWTALPPLPKAQFARDFGPGEWRIAEDCLARAAAVETLAPSQERPDAYLATGLDMVERADVLLALWDGQPARGKGGTSEVVAYARQIGRPLVCIDAETLVVEWLGFGG